MVYYLSLGSNLGQREETISRAIDIIDKQIGRVTKQSAYYYSAPWGFESENPFCNVCVCLETNIQPLEVLHQSQAIERLLGRSQKSLNGHYHDRTIDIDLLICYQDGKPMEMHSEELTLPHPLMEERDFVMIPLKEITKNESILN